MKFKVCRSSDFFKYHDVEINTLEELLEFTKQEQANDNKVCGVIISWDKEEKIWEAEIYDDYRE